MIKILILFDLLDSNLQFSCSASAIIDRNNTSEGATIFIHFGLTLSFYFVSDILTLNIVSVKF